MVICESIPICQICKYFTILYTVNMIALLSFDNDQCSQLRVHNKYEIISWLFIMSICYSTLCMKPCIIDSENIALPI